MVLQPKAIGIQEMMVGLSTEFSRDIVEEDIFAFATISGDHNPLHIDKEYAKKSNYGAPIVHGAFQVGLASAMIGMHLPGLHVLLNSINSRFLAPLYYPCTVEIRAEVTSWNLESRSGLLKVLVIENRQKIPTAEIHMAFTMHEHRDRKGSTVDGDESDSSRESGAKTVLVSGASGGVGEQLLDVLSREYNVLALYNRSPPPKIRGVRSAHVDFLASGWKAELEALVQGKNLYAVIHAAWPGVPSGGLLQTPDDIVKNQLHFACLVTTGLARLLYNHVDKDGGRLVALSSIVGSHKPVITLSSYSLGKATLEQTIRLLAPELARRKVTANAICPTFIPAGMNKQMTKRQKDLGKSQIPMGRLCTLDDVSNLIIYLLSESSGFVSGQVMALSGGQL